VRNLNPGDLTDAIGGIPLPLLVMLLFLAVFFFLAAFLCYAFGFGEAEDGS